jgi:formamidopyrimidine-DNA glycosylase
MPELPDVTVYIESLERFVGGRPLKQVRLASPFLLRSVTPPLSEVAGRTVTGFRRLGKRIVWSLEGDLHLVLHLMIAGRLRWKKPDAPIPKKVGLAAFDFEDGAVILTEASKKKRASLYVVEGEAGLGEHDRGGLELAGATLAQFAEALTARNHTLKRALTDPRILSGVGNAYSDEILHAAELSPLKWTERLTPEEFERLFRITLETLDAWTERTRDEVGAGFPDKVTAFRDGMAVHGRFREPCPRCGDPVQRIRYADNETNYCPICQTGGRLLADRSLSRLMKKDWPRTLAELEERRSQ